MKAYRTSVIRVFRQKMVTRAKEIFAYMHDVQPDLINKVCFKIVDTLFDSDYLLNTLNFKKW
jgi:hypothetical protein